MPDEVKGRRPYRSDRRREAAEETRRRILAAAGACLVEGGYAGTSIAAIARAAGTAPETIYAVFGTKPQLLVEVVREAARGPAPGPILDQEGPRAVAAAGDAGEALTRFADDVVARLERVGPVLRVLATAAQGEPALAAMHADLHEQRRRNLATLVDGLAARGELRQDRERALDTVWGLASPELYDLLTAGRGWTREEYASWLAEGLDRLLRD